MKRWRFSQPHLPTGDGTPVDRLVARRVRPQRAQRRLAQLSQQIVTALGRRSDLWFAYEEEATALELRMDAAYYELGIDHGRTAAVIEAEEPSDRHIRDLADRLVASALDAGLGPSDAAAAAMLAAWTLAQRARRPQR